MSLPLKTWKDSPKALHPQDSAFEVINGIIRKNLKGYTNEPGCVEHSPVYNALNYKQVGIFNAKYGDKIIFSIGTDNKSKIGIIKADGTYVEKLSEFLGFSEDHPIDCESYYNYKGELNIAFTDYNMTPKLINLDDIKMPFNINDIQLFSFFQQPQVTPTVEEAGGSVKTGAWFPFFAFKDNTSITPFTSVGNPVFINRKTQSQGIYQYDGDPAGTPTSKSIKLTLENVDTNYDTLVVGFVSKIDGVLEARIVKEVPITGSSMVTFFTGGESSTLISLEQLLTSSSVYDKIKHFTQVEGVLYGAGTAESSPINFQKYANLIKLKYIVRQIHYNGGSFGSTSPMDYSYKTNKQNNLFKGWASQEAYAFFIKVKVKGRGLSEAFLISGRPPEGNETAYYSTLGAGYDTQKAISSTAKVYQIDDTAGANGKFGYWENEDEYYPNTDDFAPVNGSEDLRGKRIRHHRFPSIAKMKELGLGESGTLGIYGATWMNALGIEVESFPTLPSELADQIEGYQIFYAKRSADNSLVNGQSLLVFNSRNRFNLSDDRFLWGGGNWDIDVDMQPNTSAGFEWKEFTDLNKSSVRLNSFDLMLDKPTVNPTYLSSQIKMKSTVPSGIITYKKGRYFFRFDYTDVLRVQILNIDAADKIKKINSFRYIPGNTNVDNYVNIIGEETAVAKVEGSYNLTTKVLRTSMYKDTVNEFVDFEETFLANIMAYKTNLYNSYSSQQLASTNRFVKLTDTNKQIWGGDINIVADAYVSFAAATPQQLADPTSVNPPFGIRDSDNIAWCTKVLRAFLKESINNASLRHEVDGQPYTKYYPKEPIGVDQAWFSDFHRTTNPNVIAYNKDYSSLGDLNPSVIANTEKQFVAEDPYKIIRSRIPSAEERDSSWKVFLANDYYIIPKDKGFITNIQGAGKDLFINCELTLLKTQGAEELATNNFRVVLGTGNIFERPPIELVLDKEGYAGCQHKHSCLLTRYGYFFVDEDRKKVFIANSTVKDITVGLQNFFRDELKTTGDNPYRERGYTAAWDDEYSRIILASKEAGFTRSYDPDIENWVSRHTYLPNQLIGDRNSLYALNDGKIYKHNIQTVRGIYYNPENIDPFVIVLIPREEGRQISLTNVQWSTNVMLGESNMKDLTFSSILAWNSYQSTEEMSIVPFNKETSLENNFDNTNARRVKNIWNFNKLKDYLKVTNQQFIDDIDLMPNVTEPTKPFYLKKMLSDDYVAIKLLFSNQKIGTLQAEIQFLNFGVNGNIVTR